MSAGLPGKMDDPLCAAPDVREVDGVRMGGLVSLLDTGQFNQRPGLGPDPYQLRQRTKRPCAA